MSDLTPTKVFLLNSLMTAYILLNHLYNKSLKLFHLYNVIIKSFSHLSVYQKLNLKRNPVFYVQANDQYAITLYNLQPFLVHASYVVLKLYIHCKFPIFYFMI